MAEIGPNQEQQRKPGWRKRKSTAGKLLGTLIGVVVLIVLIGLVVLVTGCGGLATATTAAVSTTITTTSEKYEGTWIQKEQLGGSTETPIIIKKVGDQYAVTGPGGETYGYMLHTDPAESGQYSVHAMILDKGATATKVGDMLKLSTANQTIEITVSGDAMTMVVPGVEGIFPFSRVATTTAAEDTTTTEEATTTTEKATTTTEVQSQKWGTAAEVNGLRITVSVPATDKGVYVTTNGVRDDTQKVIMAEVVLGNIGSTPHIYHASDFTLYDTSDNVYLGDDEDSSGGAVGRPGLRSGYLQPGKELNRYVAYIVPADTAASRIEYAEAEATNTQAIWEYK